MPRLLAKYRPPIPILFLTNDPKMAQQVLINRGCVPVVEKIESYEDVKSWTIKNLQGTVVILTESQGPHQLLGIVSV
jgi:pyruvate kinase